VRETATGRHREWVTVRDSETERPGEEEDLFLIISTSLLPQRLLRMPSVLSRWTQPLPKPISEKGIEREKERERERKTKSEGEREERGRVTIENRDKNYPSSLFLSLVGHSLNGTSTHQRRPPLRRESLFSNQQRTRTSPPSKPGNTRERKRERESERGGEQKEREETPSLTLLSQSLLFCRIEKCDKENNGKDEPEIPIESNIAVTNWLAEARGAASQVQEQNRQTNP
jgi:hypothetical protein